jgi:hypothetical protein
MVARRRFRWSFRDATEVRRASTYDAPPGIPNVFEREKDANAGAEGEWLPTSGGALETEFDADGRRVRLRGRDQETSENYGAELWLPNGGQGYGAGAGKPGDRKVGDAALRDLVTPKDGCAEISGLAAWQRALDRHYRQ